MSFARLITRGRTGLGGDSEDHGMLSVKGRLDKLHVHELLGSID